MSRVPGLSNLSVELHLVLQLAGSMVPWAVDDPVFGVIWARVDLVEDVGKAHAVSHCSALLCLVLLSQPQIWENDPPFSCALSLTR